MDAKTKNKKQKPTTPKCFDAGSRCACACSMEGLSSELGFICKVCFRDKVTVRCRFLTKADVLPSDKLIKWCRLFSPPDICDLFSFEDLNILMPVFPECVREDHFLLLYRRTEGNKQTRSWIITVEAWFIICVFVSGEVWWMPVVTGILGWTEHKGLFSRWVPGPKGEDTHLAETRLDSKMAEAGSHFAPCGINISRLTF